jgi:hypothetical protein
VWFFCLGERHHKPVMEWLQQQLTQQQQQHQGISAAVAADGGATGPAFTVVGTMKEVPQVGARGLLGVLNTLVWLTQQCWSVHSIAGQCSTVMWTAGIEFLAHALMIGSHSRACWCIARYGIAVQCSVIL